MSWYWVMAIMFPIAWLVQNCLHELSHLVVGYKVCGDKPIGFYPYPHFYEGRFYFARSEAWVCKDHYLKHVAPFYAAIIWVWLTAVVGLLVPEGVDLYIIPFAVCGLVDAGWWLFGTFSKNQETDYNRWKRLKYPNLL